MIETPPMIDLSLKATDQGWRPRTQQEGSQPTFVADAPVRLPLVTVIVTNFNYRDYVAQAIASVAQQVYSRIECIVVDDCSTDGSRAEIERVLAGIGRDEFSALLLEENVGQLGAMAAGLQRAKGVFVNFLDADDVLMPGFVAAHVRAHLNSMLSCSVSASDTVQIDESSQVLEGTYHSHWKWRGDRLDGAATSEVALVNATRVIPERALPIVVETDVASVAEDREPHYYIERHYQGWPVVASSSFVFRRNVALLSLPRDTRTARICADYYLYKIAHAIGGTICIPTAHSYYRLHQRNAFAVNPVVGGPYRIGNFSEATVRTLDGLIAQHVLASLDTWSNLLGPMQLASIVQNGIFGAES